MAQFQREATEFGTREGILDVRVVGARNLLAKDAGGVSDPFVTVTTLDSAVRVRGHESQTPVIDNTVNPMWNKDFAIPIDRDW